MTLAKSLGLPPDISAQAELSAAERRRLHKLIFAHPALFASFKEKEKKAAKKRSRHGESGSIASQPAEVSVAPALAPVFELALLAAA